MKRVVFELNKRYKLGLKLENDKVLYRSQYDIYKIEDVPIERLIVFDTIDELISEIKCKYEKLIQEEKLKIRTVTKEDKEQEIKENYDSVMKVILTNCERLLKAEDETERWNRLREITNLKKQLYSGECLGNLADEVHRANGRVKYNIKCLQDNMSKDIAELQDDWIKGFGIE